MHATKALQEILSPVIGHLDTRNARNLFFAVEALLVGRRLTLMELARHFPGALRIKAPLKRLDRLLGNPALHAVRARFYHAALQWLLHSSEPVLIIDWSDVRADRRWQLLRAAVVAKGRAITVYEEVHPLAKLGSPCIEAAFLKRLQSLLPPTARPILLADAGFRVPWFRAVEALGWQFIARVRHRSRVRFLDQNRWIASKKLYARAGRKAVSLGEAQLTESKCFPCRLVLVRRARRGRIHLTSRGERARGGHSRKMAEREREPWLLAASISLSSRSAGEIVALYAKRMQIEQSFRDLKSHRYGAAFEDSLTRDPKRLEMLLLIHALATLAAWLEGLAVASAYLVTPTNRVAHRTRHSLVWLGWESLRRHRARLSWSLHEASTRLRELLAHPI
jgi:hypothetical protein